MKIVINSLALLFIPVFLFAGYTYAKSNSNPLNTEPEVWPFLVEEVLPNGETIIHSGSSSEVDLRTISVDLDLNPYPEDRLSSFPELGFEMGGKITLHRAPSYTIFDGKKPTLYRSWAESVGELLAEKKVTLGDEDKINFATSENLTMNMEIKIVRVARTNLVKSEVIKHQTIEKADSNLERGKSRIEQNGEDGIREFTYEVIREDGEEISRTLINNKIAKKPVATIKYYGTKVIVLSSVRGIATLTNAYPSSVVSANYRRGTLVRITNLANGKRIEKNVTHTWGIVSAPSGVVLDVGINIWRSLGYSGWGKGPNVLVEEIND